MLLNKVIYTLPSRLNKVIYTFIRYYYRKKRSITFRDLKIDLLPTVFHPTLYLTTETLLDHLLTLDLKNKSILELGCGSAAISLYLSKYRHVKAHASDINLNAVKGAEANAMLNNIKLSTYHSNLFSDIPKIDFDVLIINPPFFQNATEEVDEFAFNAGKNFEYFINLSKQLLKRENSIKSIYMILTDKCDLDKIMNYFQKDKFNVTLDFKKKVLSENHLIYLISMI